MHNIAERPKACCAHIYILAGLGTYCHRSTYIQHVLLSPDSSVVFVFEGRFIVLAERIEGCVAADGSGRGSLSPEEIREIFVVNR